MNTTNHLSTTAEACPLSTFVITLGRALLQEKQRDWLDMDAAAEFCRQHAIQLNLQCPSASELDTTLRQFFFPTGEFYAAGVNVDGYERPRGWERPFQIRAYPHTQIPNLAWVSGPSSHGTESASARIGNNEERD